MLLLYELEQVEFSDDYHYQSLLLGNAWTRGDAGGGRLDHRVLVLCVGRPGGWGWVRLHRPLRPRQTLAPTRATSDPPPRCPPPTEVVLKSRQSTVVKVVPYRHVVV